MIKDLNVRSYKYENKVYIPHFNWVIDLDTLSISETTIPEIREILKKQHNTILIPYDLIFNIKHFQDSKEVFIKTLEEIKNITDIFI